jgi:Gpi18-like mannosyltransferase
VSVAGLNLRGRSMREAWRRWKSEWWPEPDAARTLWEQLAFSRLALVALGWVALGLLPWQYVSPTYNVTTFPPVLMWIRWDALWYIDIANHGYWTAALAFFPLYPLVVAGVHWATGLTTPVAALVASNLALVGTVGALWLLVREYYPRAVADRAVTLLLMFPTAFYLSAAYTESLFLFTTVTAFLLAKRRRLWAAGVVGALAALTRNQGILTFLPILAAYGEQYGWKRADGGWNWRRWEILSAGIPFLGLATYMVWQWVIFHSPLTFLSSEADWGRHVTWPWVGIAAAVATIWNGSPLQPAAVLSMIDLLFTLGFLVLWWVGRRQALPWSWLIYWALLWLIDVTAPDLYGESPLLSMSRLVLVIFPAFVTLGIITERPGWNRWCQWLFPMLQAVFFTIFATWHWIA